MSFKPLLFISHINEEKELALAFKELVEGHFLGLLEVFVSSDENSIPMGRHWLDNITEALRRCHVEVVLCSPKSVNRPWINFEAGAGWVRNIPVIPLCHSGIEPHQLPMPLNLLQAAKANEVDSLKLIFPVLANALGAKCPDVDFSQFTELVRSFEGRYTFWDECNYSFSQLNRFDEKIISSLKVGQNIPLVLAESDFNNLQKSISFLIINNILTIEKTGGMMMTGTGVFYNCALVPLSKLSSVLSDKNFRINS